MMERPGVDSEEKHEPVRNIDIVVVDSLKALDPKRPIREADIVFRPLWARSRHDQRSLGYLFRDQELTFGSNIASDEFIG